MSKGIRISEAAYLELRRRAEAEKRTLQAVVDLLLEQTSAEAVSREAASRELKAWLETTRESRPVEFLTGMTLVRKPEAEREAAARATAAKVEMPAKQTESQAVAMGPIGLTRVRQMDAAWEAGARDTADAMGRLWHALDTDLAASSEHGAPAAGRTDTSAAGCASTGVPPEGEPRSGGGEAAGTPGSSRTAAPPMASDPRLCLCGHTRDCHGEAGAPCVACECQSFVDLKQDLF